VAETIREHLKRRARLSLLIVLCGIGLLSVCVAVAPRVHAAGALALIVFALMAVGSIAAAAGMRCPGCGRWYTRDDYARFTWFFLREPDACPRCGESYDAPWRKWSRTPGPH
jgi:hypothetical protein